MIQRIVWLILACTLACWSQAGTKPYAQMLVDETMLRNPDLAALSIAAQVPATADYTVVASSHTAMIGSQVGSDEKKVLADGQSVVMTGVAHHGCQVVIPLRDVSGATIGALRTAFKSGESTPACVSRAEALRDDLRQVIPSALNLFDPFIVGSSSDDILGQRLVMETLAKHPDVLVLALHITPPGEATNRVVAINERKFIGRPSDDVDHDVARTGKMIMQVIPSTHRMETHMPLRAGDGSLVGTVVTVYLWRNETEVPELLIRSMKIRDELAPQIPSLEALLNRGRQAQ